MAENRTTENPGWNEDGQPNARQERQDRTRPSENTTQGDSGHKEGRDDVPKRRGYEDSPWMGGG